jgi:CMP-N,N'-diacetyllegionaminic acid synthase
MNAKPDNTLAFIPCRTTSKRLPAKNLMPLAGRKLVFRAIDFALKMGFKTVVAPDNEDVLVILNKEYGDTIILFLRDQDLADGNHQLESWAAAHEAMEVIHKFPSGNYQTEYSFGIMLEPSSPLRHEQDIKACLAALAHMPGIGTVTRNERMKAEKLQLTNQGGMWQGTLDGRINFPGGLHDIVQFNGVCYAARRDTILNQSLWDHLGTHVVEGVSFNIDTLEDFKVAEAYIAQQEIKAELEAAGGPCYRT